MRSPRTSKTSLVFGFAVALMVAMVAACGAGTSNETSAGESDASTNPSDATSPNDAATSDGSSFGPRGVYIPTFHSPISKLPTLTAALDLPYVDGVYVSRAWNEIETSEGTYAWDTEIDPDLQAIAAHGKHATLGIGAGFSAPSYICAPASDGGAGAQCIDLVVQEVSLAGNTPPCNRVALPLPWDPTLQDRFGKMIDSLAAHLAANPALAAVVVDVKITGFNDQDEETTLPLGNGGPVTTCTSGNACMSGQCTRSPALDLLTAAGYGDATAKAAFLSLGQIFHSAFGAAPIGSQVSNAMPSPEGGPGSMASLLVTSLVDSNARPLTVQDNGLTATSGVDPQTLYAHEAGVPVGYQTLFSVSGGGAKCAMGRGLNPDGGSVPCDQDVLMKAIDYGIDQGGANWLELYIDDVSTFPDAAAYAHARLVGP